MIENRWLNLAEACRYAGDSENTFKKRILNGEVIGEKKGGEWKIDRYSIDFFFSGGDDRLKEVENFVKNK